ncbi:YchJ family metal-binding protein, partial [Streptomyces alkaliphilus]|uniref:YchJ family metal-binding protein n=1 Tax=Streptomyces alkaliphilus TaxID=1472722 RepID=UPI00225E39A9
PARVDPDPALRWERLEVLAADGGGPFHAGDEATVEFRAHWRHGPHAGVLHEVSRFRRTGGRWYYLDGDVRE